MATWGDEESSSSQEDEEEANICLMVQEEPKVTLDTDITSCSTPIPLDDDIVDFTFEELQDAYNELACNFELITSKYQKKHALFKLENASLLKEKLEFEEKIKALELKVHELSRKNEVLTDALSKAKTEPRMHANNVHSKHAYNDGYRKQYNSY